MSLRLPTVRSLESAGDPEDNQSSSSEEDDEDQTWDDWITDSETRSGQSLFDSTRLPSAEAVLAYDKENHGFDLNETCSKLSLDFHGRIRLINYIRRNNIPAWDLSKLDGSEELFRSDGYLIPAVQDDILLQVQSDDWSDTDDENATSSDPKRKIQALERQLKAAKDDLAEYRRMVSDKLDISNLMEAVTTDNPNKPTILERDDDSHYFQSYGENDIHAVMIQDKVRTSTYAHFILTNPALFRDAIVLDVGCGTGILSLFAARGGAKRVIAVDASDIADKAAKIVKANGLENVITVIRGKVEEITLPDDIKHVDIIVSEWMGYALLYESMLDSVLRARDRLLRPGGVVAPSQCQMMLALCDATEIYKDRIGFWDDVYGFDLSTMGNDLYDEAIVDVVGSDTVSSAPCIIKDIRINNITTRQLNFSTSFQLISTVQRRTKINSFILYFDTFFTTTGDAVPPNTAVKVINDGDVVLAEVWPVGGKPPPQRRKSLGLEKGKITSFSTGPKSTPTHWKQTLFLLRQPITVTEGTIVHGTFYCRKSEANSRELDVEIHYSVQADADAIQGDTTIQMYKVR